MHFEKGYEYRRAVSYLIVAAQKAMARFSNRDALTLASRAIEIIPNLPPGAERDGQELLLQVAMAACLGILNGYGAPEVGEAFQRARRLWQALGESVDLAPMFSGLWRYYLIRAELNTAREIADGLLARARHRGGSAFIVEANSALGITFVNTGDFSAARAHFDEALALYDPGRHRACLSLPGHDPAVICRAFGAWVLWSVGLPDTAVAWARQATEIARQLPHPENLCFALLFNAWVHHLRRETPQTMRFVKILIRYAQYHGILQFVAFGRMLKWWALGMSADDCAAIAHLRETIELYRGLGSEISVPHFICMLAEVLGQSGRTDEALVEIDQAISIADRTGGRYFQAEAYRMKGELIRRRRGEGGRAAAEDCFRHALEIARPQEARGFEIRALLSLARLNRKSNQGQVRSQLAEACSSLSEGWDTPDLVEARTLLAYGTLMRRP